MRCNFWRFEVCEDPSHICMYKLNMKCCFGANFIANFFTCDPTVVIDIVQWNVNSFWIGSSWEILLTLCVLCLLQFIFTINFFVLHKNGLCIYFTYTFWCFSINSDVMFRRTCLHLFDFHPITFLDCINTSFVNYITAKYCAKKCKRN